jgi:hypothetical protein
MTPRIPVLTPGSDTYARPAVAVRSAATVTVGGHVVQSRSPSSAPLARASVVSVANPVLVSRPAVYSSPVIVSRPAVHIVTPSTSTGVVVASSKGSSDGCPMLALNITMLITGLAIAILGLIAGSILAVGIGIPLAGIGGVLTYLEVRKPNDKPATPETPPADANAQSKEQKAELKVEKKESKSEDSLNTGDEPSRPGQPDVPPPPYSSDKQE